MVTQLQYIIYYVREEQRKGGKYGYVIPKRSSVAVLTLGDCCSKPPCRNGWSSWGSRCRSGLVSIDEAVEGLVIRGCSRKRKKKCEHLERFLSQCMVLDSDSGDS